MSYIELHARSAFSFLRGSAQPHELAVVAAHLDLPALAVTVNGQPMSAFTNSGKHDGRAMRRVELPAGAAGARVTVECAGERLAANFDAAFQRRNGSPFERAAPPH